MRSYKTEGIIIKRTNYGEADRVLTVFTKDYGKLKVLAKGVRKINSRRGPHIELFNEVILFLHKGKTWDILSEAKAVNTFERWRKDLEAISFAYQAAELVDKLTSEGERQKEVFSLLKTYFNNISLPGSFPPASRRSGPADRRQSGSLSLEEFKVRLLEILGFLPKNESNFQDIDGYIESIIEKKLIAKNLYRG